MECNESLILISGHIDGQNSPQEEAALQAHLADCPSCRALLEAYEGIDREVAELNVPAPEGLSASVMEQIRKPAPQKKRNPWIAIGTSAGLVAAVLLVMVGVGRLNKAGLGDINTVKHVPAEPTVAAQPFETDAPACEAAGDLPEDAELSVGTLNAPTEAAVVPVETDAPAMEATDAPGYDEGTPEDSVHIRHFKRHFISPVQTGECLQLAEETGAYVLLCDGIGEETLSWLKGQNETFAEWLDEHSTQMVNEETGIITVESDYLTVMAIREYITRVLAEQVVWESPEVLESCLAELFIEYGYLEQLTALPESFLTDDLPEEWTEEFITRWFEGGNWRYISPRLTADLTQEQIDAWMNGEMLDFVEESLPELTDTAYLVLIPPQETEMP